jgi:hypothetical protein
MRCNENLPRDGAAWFWLGITDWSETEFLVCLTAAKTYNSLGETAPDLADYTPVESTRHASRLLYCLGVRSGFGAAPQRTVE